jgi:DNA-binding response OmpR family regulator
LLIPSTLMSDTREWEWLAALAAPPAHTPPRILVAEDDAAMRGVVVETLKKDGYELSEAADGGRLLVTLAREFVHRDGAVPIDLLVSDVRMPICTGLQILEQLRAAHHKMPIVLMTAFGDEGTRRRARTLGAVLLDKPFQMAELRAAVATLLRRRP